MLGGITSTKTTPKLSFGYCDVHPNGFGDRAIPYNPYKVEAVSTSQDYDKYK